MKQMVLPGTDISVSRFAFGTASLHHLSNADDRARLLASAADHGFTHFDTAPYYGFGQTERSLAPVLASRQDLTVATKVGLYPPGGTDQAQILMLARKAAGRYFPKLSRPVVDWAVKRARAGLLASLSRLGRDRVDILFLHEPDYALIAMDEWLRWLEDEKDRVRYFGIAGDMQRITPFLERESPLAAIIEASDSLDRREADAVLAAGRPLQITYGYMSAANRRSGGEPQSILRGALARNTTGAILISTRQASRLSEYAKAAAA